MEFKLLNEKYFFLTKKSLIWRSLWTQKISSIDLLLDEHKMGQKAVAPFFAYKSCTQNLHGLTASQEIPLAKIWAL